MATVDLCPSGHQLSQAQGISGYDASYLALARRHGAMEPWSHAAHSGRMAADPPNSMPTPKKRGPRHPHLTLWPWAGGLGPALSAALS